MSDVPQKGFEVKYVEARIGAQQLPPMWAVPFDEAFREVILPNAPDAAFPAYTSIGWFVVRNWMSYCPSYKITDQMNLRLDPDKNKIKQWELDAQNEDVVLVTDRRTGASVKLKASYSEYEAVVSWFVREQGHEDTVLCYDRKDKAWYIELPMKDYVIAIGADGTEVPVDEPHVRADYLIQQHPNAIMMYGE